MDENSFSAMGLTGLTNVGNTCYMNAVIQCLVHTPKFVDYFLWNFGEHLNCEDSLAKGKLAITFGDLLRQLWASGETTLTPGSLKSAVSSFAPQFCGLDQHDSQEFLSIMLNGLHKDLNRVKIKSPKEMKDHPSEDSIVVNLFQAQLSSVVCCSVCKSTSTTFDTCMELPLPLKSKLRKIDVTVVSSYALPCLFTVPVLNNGTSKDLVEALAEMCSLGENETLRIAVILNNSIVRFLDSDLVELDSDLVEPNNLLVAYRLPKDVSGNVVVFMHQREEKSDSASSLKKFGIPLMGIVSDFTNGCALLSGFLRLIRKFYIPHDPSTNVYNDNVSDTHYEDFELYLQNETFDSYTKINLNKPVPVLKSEPKVIVTWHEKVIGKFNTSAFSLTPEINNTISLYECVEDFLEEEPLGPEWCCCNCKNKTASSKKLNFVALPEILVIHLKRFSHHKGKQMNLTNFVDFPIHQFDLSKYVIQKNDKVSSCYELYAINNHYGELNNGHHTAIIKQGQKWFQFNDSFVSPILEEEIKTAAAYILFYRRL